MGDADSWVTEFKVVLSDDGRKWFPLITDDGDDVVNIRYMLYLYVLLDTEYINTL